MERKSPASSAMLQRAMPVEGALPWQAYASVGCARKRRGSERGAAAGGELGQSKQLAPTRARAGEMAEAARVRLLLLARWEEMKGSRGRWTCSRRCRRAWRGAGATGR
jgi:hypothetical protein